MQYVRLLDELLTPKKVETPGVNILNDDFYDNIIYNGPPQTRSEEPMFRLLAANMGIEYAIIWALDLTGNNLFKYITNPSRKVLNKAISMDCDLYDKYKDKLIEDDLIKIVQTNGSGLFGPYGWRLLYKLDPQPTTVIKAALEADSAAIEAVKNQTAELCEYCVFHERFCHLSLDHIKCRTEKIENKIFENVTNGRWSFKYLPKKLITRDLLEKTVVKDYDDSLQYVVNHRLVKLGWDGISSHLSDDLVDESLVTLATSNPKSSNFRYVPDSLKTIEMCRKFIKLSIHNLMWTPNKYKLSDVTDYTILKDSAVYKYIENEHITSALAKMIYSFNTNTKRHKFNFINDCTDDEIMILLRYYPGMYRNLSSGRKTFEITTHAVTLDGWNLQYVPDKYYNDEIYNIAIGCQPGAIKYKRNN